MCRKFGNERVKIGGREVDKLLLVKSCLSDTKKIIYIKRYEFKILSDDISKLNS